MISKSACSNRLNPAVVAAINGLKCLIRDASAESTFPSMAPQTVEEDWHPAAKVVFHFFAKAFESLKKDAQCSSALAAIVSSESSDSLNGKTSSTRMRIMILHNIAAINDGTYSPSAQVPSMHAAEEALVYMRQTDLSATNDEAKDA